MAGFKTHHANRYLILTKYNIQDRSQFKMPESSKDEATTEQSWQVGTDYRIRANRNLNCTHSHDKVHQPCLLV